MLLTGYHARVTPGGRGQCRARLWAIRGSRRRGSAKCCSGMPTSVELKASDRIRYGGRALAIRGLEDIDNARRYLRLFCVEDVP